ncbi:MAG: SurA N-terminal domain-containing protein [Chloroflexota bacterium]|nr:SurA N-terminal domain-containing protein [Chloroflexota bacterium]
MADQKQHTRRQHVLHQKDQNLQRLIAWIAAGIGALLLGVLAYGLLAEYLIKPQQAVATIGEGKITVDEYQDRVRYERIMLRSQIAQYQNYLSQIDASDPTMQSIVQQLQSQQAQMEQQLTPALAPLFGGNVLDKMVEEQLIRQAAAKQGIEASAEDVELQIEQMMGYDREATQEITSTEELTDTAKPMTAAEYHENYTAFVANFLGTSGLSEESFRQLLAINILKPQVVEGLAQDMVTVAEQTKINYISTKIGAEAAVLEGRLSAGETDIAALTEELNGNENPDNGGGSLPWYPLGYIEQFLGAEVESAAFDTPVGEISAPVQGQDESYYIIYVEDREERPLSETLLQQEQLNSYNEWLTSEISAQVEKLDWQEVTPDQP